MNVFVANWFKGRDAQIRDSSLTSSFAFTYR